MIRPKITEALRGREKFHKCDFDFAGGFSPWEHVRNAPRDKKSYKSAATPFFAWVVSHHR